MRRRFVIALLAACDVQAQAVRGKVVDDSAGIPIQQATVELLDTLGRTVKKATTDSTGRFALRAPSGGAYELRVRRLGFAQETVKLLNLTTDSIVNVQVSLRSVLATLSPTMVQATRHVFTLVRPTDLGRRLIAPERVAEVAPRARTVEDYVLLQSIPGVSIYDEPPNIRCARLVRGKPITGRTALGDYSTSAPRLTHSLADAIGCMLMFVDNVRVEDLTNVDPNTVDMLVVLLPHEAGVLYGTGASRGVLLVYTKGHVR